MTLEIAAIIRQMAQELAFHRTRLDDPAAVIMKLVWLHGFHPEISTFIGRHYDSIIQEASKINADRGIRPHVG
jgi:hypothetical protein